MLFDPQKEKRQIEILGLCLNNTDKLTTGDLSFIFDLSIPTIERDLKDLRSRGIQINSYSGQGVLVDKNINPDLLKNELLRYIAICYSNNFDELIDMGYHDVSKKHLLETFVLLQKSIESKTKVRIKDNNYNININIEPRTLIRKNKDWILIIQTDKSFKEIRLENLINLEPTEESFNPYLTDNEMYKIIDKNINSDKLNTYEIKLSFAKQIEGNIPSQMLKVKILKKEREGSFLLKAECQDLDDLVPWIFKNANDIIVLEPKELKDKIVSISKIVLEKYAEGEVYYSSQPYIDSFERSKHLITTLPEIEYYMPKDNDFKDFTVGLNLVF